MRAYLSASRTRGSNPVGPTPPKDFPFVIAQQHTPYVATQIFGLLDKKSLLKCRTVCKEWKKEVDKNTSLWSDIKPLYDYKHIFLSHFSLKTIKFKVALNIALCAAT